MRYGCTIGPRNAGRTIYDSTTLSRPRLITGIMVTRADRGTRRGGLAPTQPAAQSRIPGSYRLVLVVMAALVAITLPPAADAAPQRVLLMLVDTLRADNVGVYGYPRATTPNIDRLAVAGTVFTEARSTSSWTKPAVASLFTGVGPRVHGVEKGSVADTRRGHGDVLSDKYLTLAEALRAGGYATAAFVSNPHVVEETGLLQGFDRVEHGPLWGHGLADAVTRWLERPDVLTREKGHGLAARADNALVATPPPAPVDDLLRFESRPSGFRLAREPREGVAAWRAVSFELGTVGPAEGPHVFGLCFRATGRVRLSLQDGEHRPLPGWTDFASLHKRGCYTAAVDSARFAGSVLRLGVGLIDSSAVFELDSVFVLPASTLADGESQPWFAYVHFMHPHLPYRASPTFVAAFARAESASPRAIPERLLASLGPQRVAGVTTVEGYRARYDASVAEADHQIGSLVRKLAELGQLENTLLVFASDHGEEFLEHGGLSHGRTLYEESVRIPLVFTEGRALADVSAGGQAKGVRVPGLISIVDVYPTLVELAGVAGDPESLGQSLVGHLAPDCRAAPGGGPSAESSEADGFASPLGAPGDADERRCEAAVREALWITHTPMGGSQQGRTDALVRDGFKLVVTSGRGDAAPARALYNLATDPHERDDVSAKNSSLIDPLDRMLGRLRDAALESAAAAERKPGRETPTGERAEALRALGYVE